MLEAQNVHKVYHTSAKEIHVLKGVEARIEEGRFVAIVGPSGAGKSTLLHIMGGLDEPSEGRIIFKENDIYSLDEGTLSGIRNESIGFVFQFYHLLSEFTVLENVEMPLLIKPPGKKPASSYAKNRAMEILDEVGLGERLTHFPSQLSGGEQQRVAIARALVHNPSLLLCDEPTGNLDSATGEGIVSLIKKINKEHRMTVVFVTHNLELARLTDRVYHLKDGVLVH